MFHRKGRQVLTIVPLAVGADIRQQRRKHGSENAAHNADAVAMKFDEEPQESVHFAEHKRTTPVGLNFSFPQMTE